MKVDVRALLRRADILLIVPPFAWQDRPALGVHLLQALARRAGYEAQVLYSNFLFSAFFDEGTHNTIAQMQYGMYLGERLFARLVFGGPPLGQDGGDGILPILDALTASCERMGVHSTFTLPAILGIEAQLPAFLASFIPAIVERAYPIVGCTSSFEQTLASVSMLRALKAQRPQTTTILGGANCEGEMAHGIRAIAPEIDHIFSGESDSSFVAFLRGEARAPIIAGMPCSDLDALPTPDYSDYFEQLRATLPHSSLVRRAAVHLSYETSRGCWWGERSHCTFCGLNGQGMASREKSPARVLADLKQLSQAHGVMRFVMTDNIMPHGYFRSLLPTLAAELPGLRILYEEKANLKLAQVRALVEAGVVEIQPGIEALSTSLLRLMGKGTTAAQNIALLRYGKACGLLLQWNLLHGFPNEELAAYAETLALMPLLHHLQPPVSPCPVVFDRFSPYHEHPERYGITALRPFAFYRGVYPTHVPLHQLAYHFEGDCACVTRENPDIVKRLGSEVVAWRKRYFGSDPAQLRVEATAEGYRLIDTRGLPENPTEQRIDAAQAMQALVSQSGPARGEAAAWALAHRVCVGRDGKRIALAVAEPALLARFEQQYQATHKLTVLEPAESPWP